MNKSLPKPKKSLKNDWETKYTEHTEKLKWLEERINQLEKENRWLEKEVEKTYTDLLEERKKRRYLEELIQNESLKIEPLFPKSLWKVERFNEARKLLEKLKRKIIEGKEISKDDFKKFIEIDILSDKYPELKKKIREIIIMLEKTTPAEIVELERGEIKEIDEDIIIRRRKKDGVVEIIFL